MPKIMTEEEKETREFLESLSVVQMRHLLNAPEIFLGIVLEHAVESEKVSGLIDAVLDQEYAETTPEQRGRIDALAEKIRKRHLG